MFQLWLSLVVCILGYAVASRDCEKWLKNSIEIEKLLLGDADAMRELDEAFYPVNEHSSLMVEVIYELRPEESYNWDNRKTPSELGVSTYSGGSNRFAKHGLLKRESFWSLEKTFEGNHSVTFRWMNSPTYLFINPDLLGRLSLATYSAPYPVPKVTLNVSVPCTRSELQQFLPTSKDGCPAGHHDLVLKAFNNITSKLDSLVLHKISILEDGTHQNKEKGYALYYYDSNKPSGYCILDKEGQYERQRIYLGITIGFLIAFIAVCIPLVFYMIFNKFHEVMKVPEANGQKNNWRYFIWGTVATCCVLSPAITCYDIYVFQNNIKFYPTHPTGGRAFMYKIYVFFCVVISLMSLCFVSDIIFIITSLYQIKKVNDRFIKEIEIPLVFQRLLEKLPCCCCLWNDRTGEATADHPPGDHPPDDNQDNPPGDRDQQRDDPVEQPRQCNNCSRVCVQSVALFWGNLVITVFLQLFGFHVFFMGLGVLATPVHSLSMICFFVSFFALCVTFVAMLMKITNTNSYMIFFVSIFLGFLGLGCFTSLVLYYYTYFLVVEDYNYDSGMMTLLGHILPVAITSILAFCAKRMVPFIKEGGFSGGQVQPNAAAGRVQPTV